MAIFTRAMFASEGDEAGIFMDALATALVTWTAMQNRHRVTVAEAALAFNTTPEVIREAVNDESAMWIYLDGPDGDPTKQCLGLDGA